MFNSFHKVLVAAAVLISASMIGSCSKESTNGSNLSDLQIYYGGDSYDANAGETIAIPFTISGVENKTLTLTATTSSKDAKTKISNDATYAGTISFTAPSVMENDGDVVVTLSAEDKANNRKTSQNITVRIKASETFAASWVGDMKSVALKGGESFKVLFTIAGASSDNVTLDAPTATVSSGYSAKVKMSDKTNGYVTVTAPSALTSEVSIKLSVKDNYSRSSEISKTLGVVAVQQTSGAANCYILAPGASKAINAKVQGNSSDKIEFDYAVLLWQDTKSLIKSVAGSASDGVIVVTANSGVEGNALVAAVKGTTVVWSWHIWVTSYDPESNPLVYKSTSNSVTYSMIDRNLGAKSEKAGTVDCYGLLYQWGRKDPFLGTRGLTENVVASKYDIENNLVEDKKISFTYTDSNKGTNLALAIANPDAFIYCSDNNNATFTDWLTAKAADQDNDLWGYTSKYKSKYDPCPEGWRVAPAAAWTFRNAYKKAGKLNDSSAYDTTYPWYWDEKTDSGFYYHDSAKGTYYYFPMCGIRDNTNGEMKSVSGGAQYGTPEPSQQYILTEIFAFGNPASVSGLRRDYGSSVRCVKDYNY